MLSKILFFLTASVYLCNATAQISPPHTLLPRDDVTDCQNVTLGFNASCWDLIPRTTGMKSWMDTWNKTTTTCKPGELWANCFMRQANVTNNATDPIRCDLIGDDVCHKPSTDVFLNATAEVGYAVAAIWGLQQYMTNLYQFIEGDIGSSLAKDGFLAQPAPRGVKSILVDILNELGDPIAMNLTTFVTRARAIGQPSFVIPTETLAPQIVGQTVGYMLQWIMKEWAPGAFASLAADGKLIAILAE